jgi:hypothetical protein
MPEFIVRTFEDEDGLEQEARIPANWEICGTCRGNGQHSRNLGAFTQDEWDAQGFEFQEEYLAGAYDSTCESCDGTGKVLVADWDKASKALSPATLAAIEAEDEAIATLEAEEAAERRYFYGPEY